MGFSKKGMDIVAVLHTWLLLSLTAGGERIGLAAAVLSRGACSRTSDRAPVYGFEDRRIRWRLVVDLVPVRLPRTRTKRLRRSMPGGKLIEEHAAEERLRNGDGRALWEAAPKLFRVPALYI
jgi:hypothetical protein